MIRRFKWNSVQCSFKHRCTRVKNRGGGSRWFEGFFLKEGPIVWVFIFINIFYFNFLGGLPIPIPPLCFPSFKWQMRRWAQCLAAINVQKLGTSNEYQKFIAVISNRHESQENDKNNWTFWIGSKFEEK